MDRGVILDGQNLLDRGVILDGQPVLNRSVLLDDEPVLDRGVILDGKFVGQGLDLGQPACVEKRRDLRRPAIV